MYKHILIATDGSNLAGSAASHGLSLASEHNAKVTIVTVTGIWSIVDIAARTEAGETDAIQKYEEFQVSMANKILFETESKAKSLSLDFQTVHVKDKFPADGIIDTAEQENVDLIVMASHGRRGIQRALLGSVANEVVSRATVPVLIYR
mgnify:CR=1 FL=1